MEPQNFDYQRFALPEGWWKKAIQSFAKSVTFGRVFKTI
jgi:hypothetical protein